MSTAKPTDTQMLNWIADHLVYVAALKGKGHRIQISYCMDGDDTETVTAKGRTEREAFKKAVLKAMTK